MIFNYIQSKVEFSSTALSNKCITELSVHTDYFIMAMMLRMKTKCSCTGMTGIQNVHGYSRMSEAWHGSEGKRQFSSYRGSVDSPKEKLKESTLDTPDEGMKVNTKKYL